MVPTVTVVDASYGLLANHALVAAASTDSANSLQSTLESGIESQSLYLSNFGESSITSSSVSVLTNDSTDSGGTLIVSAINGDSSAVGQMVTLRSGATVQINSDGSLLYVPVSNSTYTDSFTYTATDGTNPAKATVTIQVVSITFGSVGDQTNYGGDAVRFADGATDSAGNALSYSASGLPSGLSIESSTGTIYGTIASDAWSPRCRVFWSWLRHLTPPRERAQLRPSIGPSRLTPTTRPIRSFTTPVLTIDLSRNVDQNSSDALAYSIVGGPANGQLTANQDGTFSYEGNPGWVGTDTFTFAASDGAGESKTATATINVVETPPTASNGTYSVDHGCSLPDIDLSQLVSDADGAPLTTTISSGPANGQLTQNPDGTYSYMPDLYYGTDPYDGYIGTDSFTFNTTDGVATSVGTVTINVTQYAPVNADGSYSVWHRQTLPNINFANNDTDADGNASAITIETGPSHGSLTGKFRWNLQLHRERRVRWQ